MLTGNISSFVYVFVFVWGRGRGRKGREGGEKDSI